MALAAAGLRGPRGGGPHAIAGGQRLVIAAIVGIGRASGFVAVVCQTIGRCRGRIDCVARLALTRAAAATATTSAATATARPPLFIAVSGRLTVRHFGGPRWLGDQVVAGAVEPTIAVESSVAVSEFIAVVAGAAIEWLAVGRGQAFAATLAPRLDSFNAAIPAATAAATAAAPTAPATRAVFSLALAAAFFRLAARQGTECRGFVIPVAAGLSTARFLVASAFHGATVARRHGPILEGSLLAGFHRAAFRGAGFGGPRRGRGCLARRR